MASTSRNRNGGADPLPLPLPLPVDNASADDTPTHSLPTNSKGELTPAQRARLGLDIYGDDTPPPPPQPINGNGNGNGHAAPAASDFGFSEVDPYEPEPQLAPVSEQPKLAPVRSANVRIERDADEAPTTKQAAKKPVDDGIPDLNRDRNVLTYGISWTIFAVIVMMVVGYFSAMRTGSNASMGPGPLVPGLVSIAIGWVIVFAARGMGKNWVWLMSIPLLILVVGPFFANAYWSTSLADGARSYLSSSAASVRVDSDPTSTISETVNTDRGCFAFTQFQDTKNVEVAVVTPLPTTARQQADLALAPRYARRVGAGGPKLPFRVFLLERGQMPVIATEVKAAPLDCAMPATP